MKAMLWVVSICVFFVCAGFAFFFRHEVQPNRLHSFPRPNDFACPGRIEPVGDLIHVAAPIEGVLASVSVRSGDKVSTGQILAVVDRRELSEEVRVARARLASARSALARLKRGSREEERRRAAAETARAEAVLIQARATFERRERLFCLGDISAEARDAAKRDLAVAEATLRALSDHESLVNAGALPEELDRTAAEVSAAEAELAAAEAMVAKCYIRAPAAGTILRADRRVGESVDPRTDVVLMADLSAYQVRAEVDERDIARIQIGAQVRITSDSFNGKQIEGVISGTEKVMGRRTTRSGDPSEKSDRDILEVLITLPKTDLPLLPDMRVTVRFS